jgi:hypothetical protein
MSTGHADLDRWAEELRLGNANWEWAEWERARTNWEEYVRRGQPSPLELDNDPDPMPCGHRAGSFDPDSARCYECDPDEIETVMPDEESDEWDEASGEEDEGSDEWTGGYEY